MVLTWKTEVVMLSIGQYFQNVHSCHLKDYGLFFKYLVTLKLWIFVKLKSKDLMLNNKIYFHPQPKLKSLKSEKGIGE